MTNDAQLIDRMTWGTFDGGPGSGNFGHAGRPGEVGGSASAEGSEKSRSYYGKTGKIKYRDLEFEINEDGKVTSGPKEFMEGLKHPKAPGEDLSQGEVVVYAPKWRSSGEEKYIHVILEERGSKYLIGTLNGQGALGRTETVTGEMIQAVGYNAGVNNDWKKYNDPDAKKVKDENMINEAKLVDEMTWGDFTGDAKVSAKEKETVLNAYKRKLEEYRKKYAEAQNKADTSGMYYLRKRIQETEKDIKAVEKMQTSDMALIEQMTWGQFTDDALLFKTYLSKDNTCVIDVLSNDKTTVKWRERFFAQGGVRAQTHTTTVEVLTARLRGGHFRPVTALSDRMDKYLAKDAKYKHWTEIYDREFNQIVNKYAPDWSKVAAEVRNLYNKHRGDPLWDEAYKRWLGN